MERCQKLLKKRNIPLLKYEIVNNLLATHYTFLIYRIQDTTMHLFFITNNLAIPKKVKGIIYVIALQIEANVVTENEYKTIQHLPDDLIVKQAIQHNIILHGIESYYYLIKRGS